MYNMDEKGFMLGTLKRSLRIFSKASWKAGKVKEPLQDGSHEWITVMGCVCGDESSLSLGIIYQGVKGIQSTWCEGPLLEMESRVPKALRWFSGSE
jgi:hypothetical protein